MKKNTKSIINVRDLSNLEETEAQSAPFQPAWLKGAADCFSAHSPLRTSALTTRIF